jgi:hypothetical protein
MGLSSIVPTWSAPWSHAPPRGWGRQRGTGSSTPAGSGSPSGEHACAKGLSFRQPMAKVTSGDVAVSKVPVEPTK